MPPCYHGDREKVVPIAARYATAGGTYTNAAGAVITVLPGETRDSVTDSVEIAIWSANWTATVPTAASAGTALFGWLAVYPRGTV
jgi:ethanolamine utilization microcompartment shell protein EutL